MLSNCFRTQSVLQSVVEHISDIVTNVHSLNTEDLDRLISVIRQQREKLDSVRFNSFLCQRILSFLVNRTANTFTIVSWKSFSCTFITNEAEWEQLTSFANLLICCFLKGDRKFDERIEHCRSRFETNDETTEMFVDEFQWKQPNELEFQWKSEFIVELNEWKERRSIIGIDRRNDCQRHGAKLDAIRRTSSHKMQLEIDFSLWFFEGSSRNTRYENE